MIAVCAVMGRPAEIEESLQKEPMMTGASQTKGTLSDPETDEVGMKNRMYQFSLGPPQGFIPVYYMMPPPPPPNSGCAKQRMRRPYQKEREQDRPMKENLNPSSDLEHKKSDDPSVADPEPGIVKLSAGQPSDMDRHQPELSAEDLEQLKTFSSLVQPPRAISSRLKRSFHRDRRPHLPTPRPHPPVRVRDV